MDWELFATIFIFLLIFICVIFKCILNDQNSTRIDDITTSRINQLRLEYRERVIEMSANQINLEETDYEVDRAIIKSLQEKYKIGVSYSRHLKANHYKSNNDEEKTDDDCKCIICLDEYVDNQVLSVMKCQHVFHYNCLKKWLNESPNCPICRTDVIKNIN